MPGMMGYRGGPVDRPVESKVTNLIQLLNRRGYASRTVSYEKLRYGGFAMKTVRG